MYRKFLELSGIIGPPMTGLEKVLEDVAAGRVSPKLAAGQIRDMARSSRERAAGQFVPVMLIGGGCLFFVVGAAFAVANYRSVAETNPVDGTVTNVDGGATQFEYTVNGVTHTGRTWIQSDSPSYTVGDKVRVLYKTNEPKEARLDSFVELWLFPVVFMPVGLVMAGGGIAMSLAQRKQST